MRTTVLTLVCLSFLAGVGFGQKRNSRPPAPASAPQSADPSPTPTPKRNERPQNGDPAKANNSQTSPTAFTPSYTYEFRQADFVVSYVKIEHDEQGRGQITFLKKGLEAPETDPVALSSVTLEKIKSAFASLNFLDSDENYQYEKDYSHLGNVEITYRKDKRQRSAKYNWTTNEFAKVLMDEYRRISNQYVWQFNMAVARENQPLNAPSLMDEFDSYLRRNEISDPRQMLPLLKELSNDERIPLIARNHAVRLVEKIGKGKY